MHKRRKLPKIILTEKEWRAFLRAFAVTNELKVHPYRISTKTFSPLIEAIYNQLLSNKEGFYKILAAEAHSYARRNYPENWEGMSIARHEFCSKSQLYMVIFNQALCANIRNTLGIIKDEWPVKAGDPPRFLFPVLLAYGLRETYQ